MLLATNEIPKDKRFSEIFGFVKLGITASEEPNVNEQDQISYWGYSRGGKFTIIINYFPRTRIR